MEPSVSPYLVRSKLATQYIFLLCGLALSSWATMVPFAKERLALDDGSLGLLLLLIGAGAITCMPLGSIFLQRYGSRIVMAASAIVLAVLLPFLLLIKSTFVMGVALFFFGAGIGVIDIAMNAHAVQLQQLYQKPIMSFIHGMFSIGGLLGSMGLGFLIQLGLSPIAAAVSIALLLLLIVGTQYKHLLEGKAEKKEGSAGNFSWLHSSVLYIGALCFIVFLAEGAMLDWSAVFLEENRRVPIAWAGIGYAAFSVAMAIMRLVGDGLVSRWNSRTVVVIGSLLGASGLLLAVLTPWLVTALTGFILLGIGAANIVPILFSDGGRIPGISPAVALPAITTLGYAGQLAGPAALGYIARQSSLPVAIGMTGVLLIFVALAYGLHPSRKKQ